MSGGTRGGGWPGHGYDYGGFGGGVVGSCTPSEFAVWLMAEDSRRKETPPIYESVPPEWLPQTSSTADIGYQGFHPPVPGQDEDILSEANVKNGFTFKNVVTAETYTAKSLVVKAKQDGEPFAELENFMNQIFQRRVENLPKVPTSSFRMPSRVTLNEAKRQAWFADLADPSVPLYKLGKSIPHGARGHDLLDLLQTNNVAIPRAVWFIRVFGSNETAGLRNKPLYNPMQYSVDWANVVTSYLKKQLTDIALPSAPRPGLNIKQTFKGVLSDTETREKWVSRFSYSLELLRSFYSESMVDHGTFLSWLVQQMPTCNLAQAGFVARLVDEYLDGVMASRAMTRPLFDGCVTKLAEIATSSCRDNLEHLQERLVHLLRRILLTAPSTFVSPRLWSLHSDILRQALTQNILEDTGTEPHMLQGVANIRYTMLSLFEDIQTRNEAMLFQNIPQRVGAGLRSAVSDIQSLNSISPSTEFHHFAFFNSHYDTRTAAVNFAAKLDVLLSWCVTPYQYGDHRPYVARTILKHWYEKAEERAIQRGVMALSSSSPGEFLQDRLFDWLDSSGVAGEVENLADVSVLFGELIETGLFDYESYVQRCIVRGDMGLVVGEEPGSRHRAFLRSFPLFKPSHALVSQRKMVLYGVRIREVPEDKVEKELRREIRVALPELFGDSRLDSLISVSDVRSRSTTLRSAARYEQMRTMRGWLLPALKAKLGVQTDDQLEDLLKLFSVSVELFEAIKCYRSILEITLDLLEKASALDYMLVALETLQRHIHIWASMNVLDVVTRALHAAQQVWKSKGAQSRHLLALLLECDDGKRLTPEARQQVNSDIAHYAQALCPLDDNPEVVPQVLPEIIMLSQDTSVDAPSSLANSLWYRYRTASTWAWKAWDNTMTSLRQIPLMYASPDDRTACALRYAKLLLHVDEHLAHGLDSHALGWFMGPGLSEIAELNADTWAVVMVVFLYLSVHGVLSVGTLLQGVVYPAWRCGSTLGADGQQQPKEIVGEFVHAASHIFRGLLLDGDDEEISNEFALVDLIDSQRVRTRRLDIYRNPHFSLLVNQIPTLVFIEHNPVVEDRIKADAQYCRKSISQSAEFRRSAYQHMDVVRLAFEDALQSEMSSERLREPLVSALCLILSETGSGQSMLELRPSTTQPDDTTSVQAQTSTSSSFLSPWKLAASAIATQFVLKQMGEGLRHDATKDDANAALDRFTENLLHQNMTAEEGDYVAEMARGIGPAVAGKFLNNGLNRIAGILSNADPGDPQQLKAMTARAGDFLRLLSNVMKPFRDNPSSFPTVDGTIQTVLIYALFQKFDALEQLLDSTAGTNEQSSTINAAIFLARLLQFYLGVAGPITADHLGVGDKMMSSIFQIALIYGGGASDIHPVAFHVLLDTCYYLFDSFPNDGPGRLAVVDLFQHCPGYDPCNLPTTMPTEYRERALSLLKFSPPDPLVSNLVYATYDSSGQLQVLSAVQNRPWEWIEYLGDPPPTDTKEQQKEKDEKERLKSKYIVRNNASISLDLFSARQTGEGVLSGSQPVLRLFEDNLTSESMYERDWREGRIYLKGDMLPDTMNTEESGLSDGNKSDQRTTYRSSPGLSTQSRASTHPSSTRASPIVLGRLPGPSAKEAIDVDNPLSTSSKRTASAASIGDDDDVVLIQGPTMSTRSASAAKKTKGKVAAKTRATAKKSTK